MRPPWPTPPARLAAPSILSADFARLGDEVRAVAAAGADWIHVDVMDGRFVPNLTIGPLVVEALRRVTDLPLDVHLMIVEPERLIPAFVAAGADHVTVHAEACVHLQRCLHQIRDLGAKAGVALNPHTPVGILEHVLGDTDLVLVMSVNPGFGGQRFIPETFRKLEMLQALMEHVGHRRLVTLDGGVSPDNADAVCQAGADVLVSGSAVFGAEDYGAVIRALRGLDRG